MTDKIKLVSERSAEEVAEERAKDALGRSTKKLAANILRIIAGGGSRRELITQIAAVVAACDELKPAPSVSEVAMEEALRSLDWRASSPGYSRPTAAELARWGRNELERATSKITQAALRLVAAQLSAQPTQESTSTDRLWTAIKTYNEVREEMRAARKAHSRVTGR
jgi:hypothetical protein